MILAVLLDVLEMLLEVLDLSWRRTVDKHNTVGWKEGLLTPSTVPCTAGIKRQVLIKGGGGWGNPKRHTGFAPVFSVGAAGPGSRERWSAPDSTNLPFACLGR